jgi:hypothetical protein
MHHKHLALVAIRCMMLAALLWLAPQHGGAQQLVRSKGQTVYVPIYSHIYGGDQERPFYLAAICSIRNTDLDDTITIEAVEYYDSDGNLLRNYLEADLVLKPLATVRYVVKESDKKGGSGAKFIVRWRAAKTVNAAIIEGIMIGTKMGQGISFVSRGQVIEEVE